MGWQEHQGGRHGHGVARRTIVAAVMGLFALPAFAATVTVDSSADNTTVDGQCTLREAILAVNATAGTADCPATGAWFSNDTIAFNISGCAGGVCTLIPTSQLPQLTHTGVLIDGYSQPGASQNTLAGMSYPNAQGLDFQIKIEIDGSATPFGVPGLDIHSGGNVVRGLAIYGFPYETIRISLGTGNLIIGNIIGLHADGSTPGSVPQHNGVGVYTNQNQIGGSTAAQRNLISANSGYEVGIFADSNTVAGNLIGTDITGTAGRTQGVGMMGVYLSSASTVANGTTINKNVIADHPAEGIQLDRAVNTQISNNAIGIGVGGVALGNNVNNLGYGGGISILAYPGGGSSDNTINNNGIAHNVGDGIAMVGGATGNPMRNWVFNNSIWNNSGLGMNLQAVGEAASTVTLNDVQDADAGPNGAQNFPAVTGITPNGGGFDVAFSLNSTPSQSFRVYGYANDACSGSGYGEGQYPAGIFASVGTDGSGNASGVLNVASGTAGWGPGKYITLQAVDAALNTSEFSACMQIPGAPAGTLQFSAPTYSVSENGASATITVTRSGGSNGAVSVHYATSDGTAGDGADYLGTFGTLNWADGDSAVKSFSITILDDALVEGNETVLLALSNATGGASLGTAAATLTIIDNDSAPPPGTPPAMGNVPDQAPTVGAYFTLDLSTYAQRTDGDPILSYAVNGTLPPGLTLNAITGLISGTPTAAGISSVTVTSSDKDGASNADAIQFTVAAAPPPPPVPSGAAPIPTLSEWALLLLSGLLDALGLGRFARATNRKHSSGPAA